MQTITIILALWLLASVLTLAGWRLVLGPPRTHQRAIKADCWPFHEAQR